MSGNAGMQTPSPSREGVFYHQQEEMEAGMNDAYTNRRYLDALKQRVLIFDGAMGTNLQKMNLTARDFGSEKLVGCNDHLVLSYPKAVESVHRSFLEVGVDVIETCTFRSNRITLGEYGLGDKVKEINKTAAQLARKLADEYSSTDHPRFVAGSIGPSGKLPSMDDPELSNVTVDDLIDIFKEQASGLIEGGVDLLLIETSQDILEVRSVIQGIRKAFAETGKRLPIQAQVTLDTTGRMLLGTDVSAVLTILQGLPIDVIGLNCSTGPEHMREPIRYLGENSPLPVSCIPNAGLPVNVDGQAVYPLQPETFATEMKEFIDKYHVNVVGGCCGTTPEHLKKLVEKVKKHPNSQRAFNPIPQLASSIQSQPMIQEPRPLLIGERLNAQGSQKVKELILAQNFDGLLSIARQQVNAGAHGLDLNVALTERVDEAASMQKAIKKLASVIRVPLVIDSTEPDVFEVALKNYPGRLLINSTNLEGGRAKADRVFELARNYNAAVICLTIDEKGMAKTPERKLEVAKRLYQIAVEDHGLFPGDLVFDTLTFTLATGDPEYANAAKATIEGIRLIKQSFPNVLTSLGVSNLAYGFSPNTRAVLNSVFLYYAVQAGLDMAIVNPAQIIPLVDLPPIERNLAEDLIFNKKPDALKALIEHFNLAEGEGKSSQTVDPLKGLNPEQRIHWRILHRQKDGIDVDIDQALSDQPERRADKAVEILNQVLLPSMKEVGDKFGTGELILPFVLQSAEVMKAAVSHLEKYLDKQSGSSKGTIVLATVYGDVHDIGKNLAKTIFSNNGYTVVDLGKQVPAETIISKAQEVNATAIGLSALLVSTSNQMPLIVSELHRRNLQIPVLIGGAAINRSFAHRIQHTEDGGWYEPGVYFCKDAFEGLQIAEQLIDPGKLKKLRDSNLQEAHAGINKNGHTKLLDNFQVSSVTPISSLPKPPFWGSKVVNDIPLDEVFAQLSVKELFRLSWGGKNAKGDAWLKMEEEFERRLETMHREALKTGWLKPQAVYGYFPVQSDGNDLIIYQPSCLPASLKEWLRFSFPRQKGEENLCLADYFTSVASNQIDVIALQVVTVGSEATTRLDENLAKDNYSEAYFTHGLAVQMAEATAEYLHQFIRNELGIGLKRGKRYSWGYPAVPNLAEHAKVFELLPAEKELGLHLTSAWQIVPEQSTAAMIVHHPEAKYFNVL
jgi:5-methyltetrahydrofolate--homocysteine methyltransferase